MKKIIFALSFLIASLNLLAQTANATWGDEFKMRKGSTDLSVIYADKTGVFVKEGHLALKSYFVIGASTRESATLIKLDKGFAEEYKSDFNKELKGKQFEDFFFIKNKLYLLASDYNRKNKTLTLHAAEINKGDGQLSGEFKSLTSWQKEERSDDLRFTTSYNSDSSKMIVVSTNEGRDKNTYDVKQFDNKMNVSGSPIVISNEFDPKTFQLEDVIYTVSGNIVMVGRLYDYETGKKKKSKNLQFKNYTVRIYNNTGSLLKEINTDIDGKWLVSTKVAQIPNKDIILAAFFSNTKRGREINGMLVQRIDPLTGEILSTAKKELNTSMISAIDDAGDDDDDEGRKERKERERLEKIQEDEDGLSKYLRFRNFVYTEDNGLVILAEKYRHYRYTTTSPGAGGMGMGGMSSVRTITYDVHECGDIMMSKMDPAGNLSWLHILPKNQREVIQIGSSNGFGSGLNFNMGTSYFSNAFNFPFYAGLGSISIPGKNTVSILFNDNTKNRDVMQLGQKIKPTNRFGKSDLFAVNLDAATGKYKRVSLFSNQDQPTAMPRLGVPIGKDFYLIGKDDKVFGKTKIAVGKVSFK